MIEITTLLTYYYKVYPHVETSLIHKTIVHVAQVVLRAASSWSAAYVIPAKVGAITAGTLPVLPSNVRMIRRTWMPSGFTRWE